MADDEVRISATLQEEVAEGMARIERAVRGTDDALDDAGRSGERSGQRIERGMHAAERGTDGARRAAEKFVPANEAVQDGLDDTGRKARRSARGLDKWARSAGFATRRASGLALALTLIKFGTLITGGAAAVSMLAALGAGAVMVTGGLAPMVGTVAVLGPGLFMLAGALGVFKLAAEDAKAAVAPLGEDLKSFRDEVSSQLIPGLVTMTELMRQGFIPVLGGGLVELGRLLGDQAAKIGEFLSRARTLNRLGEIFNRLEPILDPLGTALTHILSILLELTYAALPMATRMAQGFERVTGRLAAWLRMMTDTERAQEWLLESWELMRSVGNVLADVLVGLYNIFRIGGRIAREEFGGGVAEATQRFREWSRSVEGQADIAQYFRDAVPVIRETMLLLGALAAGLAAFATQPGVAELVAQVRTELLPALGRLLSNITGEGGLGPALVSMFTAVADALALIPLDGLVWIVQGIAGIAMAVSWLVATVPGLGTALGYFISFVVAAAAVGGLWTWLKRLWKMTGPVRTGLGYLWTGLKLLLPSISSVTGALAMLGRGVLLVGRLFGGLALASFGMVLSAILRVVLAATTALSWLRMALLWVGRALLGLLVANPIVAAIIAVVAILVWMWFKFDWFREGVMTALRAIGDFFVMVWGGIKVAAMAVWNALVIGARWLWSILQPFIQGIADEFVFAWNVIKFAVQTVIFIVVALFVYTLWVWGKVIDGIVWLATGAWNILKAGWAMFASFVNDYVIQPVAGFFTWLWNWIKFGVLVLWAVLQVGWQIFTGFIDRWVIQPIAGFFTWLWNWISFGMQVLWTVLRIGWQIFTGFIDKWVIQPVAGFFTWLWNWIKFGLQLLWAVLRLGWQIFVAFIDKWVIQPVSKFFTGLWDGIKSAGRSAADFLKGIWQGVIDVVKGAYNWIARGWNSIPSVTVPDWVPLMGGKEFSLPKLPTLWHGGTVEYGTALVGEMGPEAIIKGGRVTGMVGLDGPEIRNDLPRGGYVMPNLDTLTQMPGLTRSIPGHVAAAVSRSLPGYDALLGRDPAVDVGAADVSVHVDTGGDAVVTAIEALTEALLTQRPARGADSTELAAALATAMRSGDRQRELAARYSYPSPRRPR